MIVHLTKSHFLQAGNKEDVIPLCHHLLKSLESRLSDGLISKHALPILSEMITVYPDVLTDGKVRRIHEMQYYCGSFGITVGSKSKKIMKTQH